MAILQSVLVVLLILSCAAMIGLILIQRGKGGGLVAFGGSGVEQAFGTHAASLAQKATGVLAVLFLALTVALGLMLKPTATATLPPTPAGAPEKTSSEAPPDASGTAETTKNAGQAVPGEASK